MNRSYSRPALVNSICNQCRQSLLRRTSPWKSLSPATRTNTTSASQASPTSTSPSSTGDANFLESLSSLARTPAFGSVGPGVGKKPSIRYRPPPKPHKLHIQTTKHNVHLTLCTGNRNPIISISGGTLNFRKAGRGSYDATFQLGAFLMAKIKNMGLLGEEYKGQGGPITALEVSFRDFGPGRDAMKKILMGQEGAMLRQKITRVMDATRIKFGGTRAKKPKRR